MTTLLTGTHGTASRKERRRVRTVDVLCAASPKQLWSTCRARAVKKKETQIVKIMAAPRRGKWLRCRHKERSEGGYGNPRILLDNVDISQMFGVAFLRMWRSHRISERGEAENPAAHVRCCRVRSKPWISKDLRNVARVEGYCFARGSGCSVVAGCFAPGGTAPRGALTALLLGGFCVVCWILRVPCQPQRV